MLREDDKVAFHRGTGCVLELNDIGFVIVKLLQLGATGSDIGAALTRLTGKRQSHVSDDVNKFTEFLRSLNFMKRIGKED